jgi:hypothetical protein
MSRVRILLGTAGALPSFLTRLRQWLDHARIEPRRFHTRSFRDGAVAVELEFASAIEAERFKNEYGAGAPLGPEAAASPAPSTRLPAG